MPDIMLNVWDSIMYKNRCVPYSWRYCLYKKKWYKIDDFMQKNILFLCIT